MAPGVAPEIFPVVVLENDRPEMQYLEGGGLFARGQGTGTPGAGNRAIAMLVNYQPDTLVVVERAYCQVASGNCIASTYYYGPASAPPGGGTTVTGRSRDTRALSSTGIVRESGAYLNTNVTLPAPGGLYTMWRAASSLDVTLPVVLAPYSALIFYPDADAVAILNNYFVWRERRINPSER